MCKLTVYILTYNRADYLRKTIQSVLAQSYNSFKVIVLDNHSMDHTKSVVDEFKDDRLCYVRHNENIGGTGNIAYALSHCDTSYCVIFHDDDVMHPDFLEKEINLFEKRKDAALVCCNAFQINERGDRVGYFKKITKPDKEYIRMGRDLIRRFIRTDRTLVFPTIMYRMDIIRDNEVHWKEEAGPGGDVIFYNDILKYGAKVYELQASLIDYRVHSKQDTERAALFNQLKIYQYMSTDLYYSEILREEWNYIPRKYMLHGMLLVKCSMQGKLTLREGLDWLEKYGNCWVHPMWTKLFFKVMLIVACILPKRMTREIVDFRESLIRLGHRIPKQRINT